MNESINEEAKNIIFREARSQNKWQDKPVKVEKLKDLYDLMKWGPTSANGFPIRIVFTASNESKEKLADLALDINQKKILTAPVCAILGYDNKFFEWLPKLLPGKPMLKDYFESDERLSSDTAYRNGSLQGAYFIIAARALGLDCGPMSGFDNDKVDEAFFSNSTIKSNFICSIGYGDPEGVYPRSPRPDFDEVCTIV